MRWIYANDMIRFLHAFDRLDCDSDLGQVQLNVANGRALDDFGTLADDTFDQHDALVLQT